MLKKTEDTAVPQSKGLNTIYNILSLEREQTPNCMDVVINYDGSVEERMGTNTQNSVIIANSATAGFSPDSATTLKTNLKSFWKLDESSGSRFDASGAVTLLDSGGVAQSSGIRNQAALFNASTGQCLYADNPSTLTNNPNFSISGWVYLNSTSPNLERTLVSKRDSAVGSTITSFETGQDTFIEVGNGGIGQVRRGAQSFQVSNSTTVAGASVYMALGTGQGQITVRIETDSAGAPSGTLANASATGTIEQSSIVASFAFVGVTFNGSFTLNSGTTYWLVVKRTTETGNDQNYQFGENSSGGYASGNSAAYNDGWSAHASADTLFKIQGNSSIAEYEYHLFVNTDNIATFKVSSSGLAANATLSAASWGALGTATWYNIVAWHDSSNAQIGISVNLATNSASYATGVTTASAPFTVGAISNGAGAFMDGRIDEVGYWNSVLTRQQRTDLYNAGSGNTLQRGFDTQSWASFDFGASALRWLTVAAGTGVYASSNLGVSFVNIATDRTANYQYLDRSKNILVATSDAYDTPLAWSGSAGTFATMLNSNATACKFSINFQGFLILLNSSARKRGFFYQDENTQLTGTWANNFDIPSSADDEITAAFVLRRYLYISTRYRLYRVNYVGGNPDWQFIELKNWGFIPRTVKKLILTNQTPGVGLYYSVGEIAIGLTWDGKMRVFDGSNDQIISNPIEQDNGQCEFALNKISYEGSGPVISFAETDPNQNVYHLCVAIGKDSQATTHFMNYDGRAFAFYPWSNMPYNAMCMAESANKRYLMAFDRSGRCHMMNSGTLDANTTSITGFIDTPLIFNKTPSQSTKGHRMDMFFSNTTAGGLLYYDRIDASANWRFRDAFVISGSDQKVMFYKTIDIPETFNTYQGRLITNNSSNISFQPWRLMRYDMFNAGLGIGKND